MKVLLLVSSMLTIAGFGFYQATSWELSDDFEVRFTAKNASGTFSILKGDITFSPDDLAGSNFDMSVEVASMDTGNGLKNTHARGDNWFDAETYPTIDFQTSSIMQKDDSYVANGTLQMHGVSKEIAIPFTFTDNVFTGTFTVLRSDYGVGSTKGFAKKVPDEIVVELRVPVE